MKNHRPDFVHKAATLADSHSFLAILLAILCLVFAVNFFLTGPGSDGGSGLGGTGKFNGESGFGGTGKAPDSGSGFKLGATDTDNDSETQYTNTLPTDNTPLDALHAELEISLENGLIEARQIANLMVTPQPEFDVSALRLSLSALPVIEAVEQGKINNLVASVNLETPALETSVGTAMEAVMETVIETVIETKDSMQEELTTQREVIAADTLITSLEILNTLILAESEAYLQIADSAIVSDAMDSAIDASIRHRVVVPVRPERPDRFSRPARITPVQRVDVPAPPPVRPMRTLSTLLNR
jgi:hypothetical protein